MVLTLAKGKRDATGFGSRLKALRVAAKLTQQELADRADMMSQNIARLEAGDRSPSWATVIRIADALGVDVSEFREED